MSSGNHLGRGKVPSPLCAYMRYLTGWTGEEIDLSSPKTYAIRHGEYDRAYLYPTEHDNEFFLVENRQNFDLDEYLPSEGLAVYHCDLNGSNEWQDGTPTRHYQCALLQADGRRDLERNEDSGDAYDLFGSSQNGLVLSESSIPSTKQWDGSDSGLVVSDLQIQSDQILFRTGSEPAIIEGERTFRQTSRPDLLIPDNDSQGISSNIVSSDRGRIQSLRLDVDISHTYQGDLRVDLTSPSGTNVVVHQSDQSGQQHNLNLRLQTNDDDSPLNRFIGEPIEGPWQLGVRDLLADDVGRLDEWSLEIGYEPSDQKIQIEREPNMDIPDDDRTGIQDSVDIETEGILQGVSVSVLIEHTYRGDLLIQLISPTGETIVLKNVESDSRPNVDFNFTPETTPALGRLLGTPIEGKWTLQVRDLWAQDVGTLRSWSLQMTY